MSGGTASSNQSGDPREQHVTKSSGLSLIYRPTSTAHWPPHAAAHAGPPTPSRLASTNILPAVSAHLLLHIAAHAGPHRLLLGVAVGQDVATDEAHRFAAQHHVLLKGSGRRMPGKFGQLCMCDKQAARPHQQPHPHTGKQYHRWVHVYVTVNVPPSSP